MGMISSAVNDKVKGDNFVPKALTRNVLPKRTRDETEDKQIFVLVRPKNAIGGDDNAFMLNDCKYLYDMYRRYGMLNLA